MSSVVDALAFVKWQLNLRCQFKKSKVFERETPSLRNCFLFPFNLCLWVVVDAWSASLIYGGQINLGQAPEYKRGLISLYRTWPSLDCTHRWPYTEWSEKSTVCRGDKMTIRFVLILVGAAALFDCPAIQATEEQNQENHKTYKACVLAASEKNSKWTQYRVDVNSCRAEFDVPGKY